MNRKLSLASGLVIVATVLGPHIASAAGVTPQTRSPGVAEAGDALVRKAHWDDDWRYRRYRRYPRYDYYRYDRYDDRCRYWRRECSSRWGWGGGDYRRCLWRHGC